MQLIKELYNQDIGEENKGDILYKVRKAVRAVVFDQDKKIALFFVSKNNYHKLPGGGIDDGEEIEKTLEREVMEETGCEIDVKAEIGMTVEYRDDFEQIQFSYCFLADMIKDSNQTSFTEKEKNDGFELKWMSLEQAIEQLKNDQPNNYVGKFIRARDLEFLLEAEKLVEPHN